MRLTEEQLKGLRITKYSEVYTFKEKLTIYTMMCATCRREERYSRKSRLIWYMVNKCVMVCSIECGIAVHFNRKWRD